jgi:Short C-terminal domain
LPGSSPMHTLTSKGKAFAEDIAKRFHLDTASALHMLLAVRRGAGTTAKFNCLELGSGQWMRGGMTMAGDMFDHALKAKVNALCWELSAALAKGGLFEALPQDQSLRPAVGPKPAKQASGRPAPGTSEITGLLAKLGQLRQNGILTDEEFTTKKRELLARL